VNEAVSANEFGGFKHAGKGELVVKLAQAIMIIKVRRGTAREEKGGGARG